MWLVATVAKATLLMILLRRRLAGKYPYLTGCLTATIAKSCWLEGCYLTWGKAGYVAAWSDLQAVDNSALALVTIEAVIAIGTHFPRGKWLALTTLSVFGLFSAAAILLVYDVPRSLLGSLYAPALCMSRSFSFWCLATLLLNVAFHGLAQVGWRRNLKRYIYAAAALFLFETIGLHLHEKSQGKWASMMWMAHIMRQLAVLCSCLYWGLMNAAGENTNAPPSDPRILSAIESAEGDALRREALG